jgi:hypothetical protein
MIHGRNPETTPMQRSVDHAEGAQTVGDAALARGIVGKMLTTVRSWLPQRSGAKQPGMFADMWDMAHSTAALEQAGDHLKSGS